MTTTRKNITNPSDWWEAFQRQATHEGLTLSEWVGACCLANVDAAKLSERPPAHRPKATS